MKFTTFRRAIFSIKQQEEGEKNGHYYNQNGISFKNISCFMYCLLIFVFLNNNNEFQTQEQCVISHMMTTKSPSLISYDPQTRVAKVEILLIITESRNDA